jgi:putative YjhG/YagF family dehydratase
MADSASRDPLAADDPSVFEITSSSAGPEGSLPLDESMLLHWPSGDLFGLSQNAGMGWSPADTARDPFLILSTLGGIRAPNGSPIALGYHTGHWEVGLLMEEAARVLKAGGAIPFAGYCSDPCDGRTQGTVGMFDSLPWRNDAAITLRRLIRSLPTRKGVIGVATCDKGMPAMMMALAGCKDLPGVIVPGGVTLPPRHGEDAGKVQTMGVRYAHGMLSLEEAAELGCKACASPGGGCQFLGTAATAQVVAEALGLAVVHSALAPSGQPVWRELGRRAAHAVMRMADAGRTLADILTPKAIENAITVHAAFGGSTNLLIHIPAIAHAAGLPRPVAADWLRINQRTPRLVDALPNGPVGHPTVQVFLAGGVPEVLLHLRDLNLLHLDTVGVEGMTLGESIDRWERSERRLRFRQSLRDLDGVDPDDVILSPKRAAERGLTPTVCFPRGNLAPEGSVVKATAIDPAVVDADGVYRKRSAVRVFVSEPEAIAAIKGQSERPVKPGDILILLGRGPAGTGMEETYQVTSALKMMPGGREVALVTDARFSGVSTGACIGHVGPEALAGGPIGRLRDGDIVRIEIDRRKLIGSIDLIGTDGVVHDAAWGERELAGRPPHPRLAPDPRLPTDTRLWAALQAISGGVWGGCVYDADAILAALGQGAARG